MFKKYLRYRRKVILLFAVFIGVFVVTFLLFRQPTYVVVYPVAICLLIGTAVMAFDYSRVSREYAKLNSLKNSLKDIREELPEARTLNEEAYGEIIGLLDEAQKKANRDFFAKYNNMVDYYTVWAHQIKIPIAAMRLNIQNEDSEFARKSGAQLNRIESYVEMVLTFLRLESDSTDYLIKEYDLDAIIRGEIRKFSGEFIGRKLKLDFTPTEAIVLTDEKWLGFVIGQIISNGLKYTREGGISIFMEGGDCLCIEDTGTGIPPEDLPRIFENGFTGFNGRDDKRASGIGLYLCRRICNNLGHGIEAESEPGRGTRITIRM